MHIDAPVSLDATVLFRGRMTLFSLQMTWRMNSMGTVPRWMTSPSIPRRPTTPTSDEVLSSCGSFSSHFSTTQRILLWSLGPDGVSSLSW